MLIQIMLHSCWGYICVIEVCTLSVLPVLFSECWHVWCCCCTVHVKCLFEIDW